MKIVSTMGAGHGSNVILTSRLFENVNTHFKLFLINKRFASSSYSKTKRAGSVERCL